MDSEAVGLEVEVCSSVGWVAPGEEEASGLVVETEEVAGNS